MAQTMIGANVEQLRSAADVFAKKAQRLQQITSELGRMAQKPEMWQGPDGDAFRGAWPKLSASVSGSAEQLVVVQKALMGNATQQSGASGS